LTQVETQINTDENQQAQREGGYIYCIIGDDEERKFAYPPIGGQESRISNGVYSVSFRDIAVVISPSPIIKYPISRENTMAHQKVLEELMGDFTVLPVRFGTVAGSQNGISVDKRIREEVLKPRYKEIKELLTRMDKKIELGLKAFWVDMEIIFQEIVDENSQIKKLRQRVLSKPVTQPFGEKATLGEMVKDALERKKENEEKDVLATLRKSSVEWRKNKVFGDNMITNSAFLVEKSRVEEFDGLIDKLDTAYKGRIKFKYVGPIPIINFVELVIVLKGEESERTS